jgi:hypothetical protein
MHESPTGPIPRIVGTISTPFGRRHVKGVAVVRYLVAIWLVCLGSAFCASGHWWGAFLFPTAVGVGALAYLMPHWRLAHDPEGDV